MKTIDEILDEWYPTIPDKEHNGLYARDKVKLIAQEFADQFCQPDVSSSLNCQNMNIKKTERGFSILHFIDRYENKCSLQKSSLATENAIWFGVDDANPQIMASDAHKLGIPTPSNNGWVKFEIPKEVLLSTRMHLTQEQVIELLPILQKFAETGELS